MRVKNISLYTLSGRSSIGMIELKPGEEADIPVDIIKRQKWFEREVAEKVVETQAEVKPEPAPETKYSFPSKKRRGEDNTEEEEDDA